MDEREGGSARAVTYNCFWPSWPLVLVVFSGELFTPLVVDFKVKASGDLVDWQRIENITEGRGFPKTL